MKKCRDCLKNATTKFIVHYNPNSQYNSYTPDDTFYFCDIHAKGFLFFLEERKKQNLGTFEVEGMREKVVFT